jgi:hypothetical protein
MDTDGEEDVTERETGDLMKEAEDLLNSPSARKAPQSVNVNVGADTESSVTGAASDTGTDGKKNSDSGEKTEKTRNVSVTSSFGNLDLSKNPGVPYQAVIDLQRARTHSGLIFGNGTGTGTGNAAGPSCSDAGTKRNRFDNAKKINDAPPHSNFPAAYNSVRKAKEKNNPCIELPTVDGNRRKMARCIRPLPGFDLPGDDRQFNVNNFHIPSLKRNVSASIRRGDEGLFCVTCSG